MNEKRPGFRRLFSEGIFEPKKRVVPILELTTGERSLPPLACESKENIITERSLTKWIETMDRIKSINPREYAFLTKNLPFENPTGEDLRKFYETRLCFLSQKSMRESLDLFVDDIRKVYDPRNTAILSIPGGSNEMIGKYIFQRLPRFPVVQKPAERQYDNYVVVDDWVLTGNQVRDVVAPMLAPKQIKLYAVVVSDMGKRMLQEVGVETKAVFSIVGDDSSGSDVWNSFPIYGFHKIPDCITRVFCGSAKYGKSPEMTIFPPVNGKEVGAHSRLASTL